MSDPLFEALRATAEAPDARRTARSEAEATAAFLAAHRRTELTASGRTERRTELTASANAPISRIFGAFRPYTAARSICCAA